MTAVVRYVTVANTSAAGAGASSPVSTTGNDYSFVNLEVTFAAIINAGTVVTIPYTGSGTIKNIANIQHTTGAGVIRSTANADTYVLAGNTITYTPQTAPTTAGSSVNFLLAIGNY